MFDGLVGRFPIYNKSLDIYGYELSLCSGEALQTGEQDDLSRWADALARAASGIDLADLIGDSRALIRVPPDVLPLCEELPWPGSRLVLAVPGEVLEQSPAASAAARLVRRGFTIALHNPPCDLLELRRRADYVSICALDAPYLNGHDSRWLGRHDRDLHLLVRNVDTPDQYERCTRLGFDYYEGRFFERPRPLQSCEIPGSRLALLDLLGKLQNPQVEIAEVEAVIVRDMTLSYKLLRLINSAFYGVVKPIESIHRAVVFFGLQRVKNWASVLLVNSVDYRPRELLMTASVRGKACELLAMHLKRPKPEQYYIAGLFSLLDAIMDVPREVILERLHLAAPIHQALLNGSGPVGEVLRAVLALERADALDMPRSLCAEGLPALTFTTLYLEAIRWSNGLCNTLEAE